MLKDYKLEYKLIKDGEKKVETKLHLIGCKYLIFRHGNEMRLFAEKIENSNENKLFLYDRFTKDAMEIKNLDEYKFYSKNLCSTFFYYTKYGVPEYLFIDIKFENEKKMNLLL